MKGGNARRTEAKTQFWKLREKGHDASIKERTMNYFLAVNDRQLGTCLRMLFAEKLQPAVQTVLNEKGKIEFHISIAADQEVFEELNERYKIMIS